MEKIHIPVLFLLLLANIAVSQQVGIKTTTPDQALDVNGKIKVGDDLKAPSAGTFRYNFASGEFEGFDGLQWKSLTNKPPAVLYFDQVSSQMTNIRDAYIDYVQQLNVTENGNYFIQYSGQLDGLFGNTTTLTSDFTWVIQLVRDRAGDLVIVDNVTTSADPEPSGGGGTLYNFRPQERVMAFKTYPLMAGDKLYLRYRVNSNPGQPAATDNYFINRSRLYASRVL